MSHAWAAGWEIAWLVGRLLLKCRSEILEILWKLICLFRKGCMHWTNYILILSVNRKCPGRVSFRCFSLILPHCPIGIIMSTVIHMIVEEQKMLTKVWLQTSCDVSKSVSVCHEPEAACTVVAWIVRLWCQIKGKINCFLCLGYLYVCVKMEYHTTQVF